MILGERATRMFLTFVYNVKNNSDKLQRGFRLERAERTVDA
jgi:hypothetical protein